MRQGEGTGQSPRLKSSMSINTKVSKNSGTHFEMSMRGSAECPGSLEKSLLSMAAQKPAHSRTKLLLAMPPGMEMSLNRSLQQQGCNSLIHITGPWPTLRADNTFKLWWARPNLDDMSAKSRHRAGTAPVARDSDKHHDVALAWHK